MQINIDMAFFVTVAWQRGYLTEAERDEYHSLSHRVGLSMDHELFTEAMIREGTEAILYVIKCCLINHSDNPHRKTRDNKQRFAVPSPYGTCKFINDASFEELFAALQVHKELIRTKYGSGDGKEVCVMEHSHSSILTSDIIL